MNREIECVVTKAEVGQQGGYWHTLENQAEGVYLTVHSPHAVLPGSRAVVSVGYRAATGCPRCDGDAAAPHRPDCPMAPRPPRGIPR